MPVDQRIAWITGAGQGLGRFTALELARRGFHVAVSARTEQDLQSLRTEAEEQSVPGSISSYPLDVTDEAAVTDCLTRIESDIGPIDWVILNAGTHRPEPATALTSENFRKLFDVNLFGVVHGLVAILPKMLERGQGHIGVVSSVSAYQGLPTAAAYGASKAALLNMCESLRSELGAKGVLVSVINPGFIRTPLTDKNDFPMPFLMEPDLAARRLVDGMESGRFEITFPRRFSFILKVIRMLPYAWSLPLVSKVTKQ